MHLDHVSVARFGVTTITRDVHNKADLATELVEVVGVAVDVVGNLVVQSAVLRLPLSLSSGVLA